MGLTVLVAACGGGEAPKPAEKAAASAGPVQAPVATLAQLMRAIPFNASNIIFDTQTNDPGAPPKGGKEGDSASARFSSVYSGWMVVEHSAAALSEAANLLLIPGRVCQNGKPAPLDHEDYRKFVQGLMDVGKEALAAAKTKNQEKMVDISDKVATACANCHEVYRDRGEADGPERCTAAAK
jgi:hypothetical protein